MSLRVAALDSFDSQPLAGVALRARRDGSGANMVILEVVIREKSTKLEHITTLSLTEGR